MADWGKTEQAFHVIDHVPNKTDKKYVPWWMDGLDYWATKHSYSHRIVFHVTITNSMDYWVLLNMQWTITKTCTRVESGLDDPDNLGHLDHFLVGQVGLIRKLNYPDVTQISHVY